MAMPIDRLKSLPPELRLYVYSHLLSDDGHSTVWISQRQKTEKSSPYAESLSAVLASRGTRAYAAYRRRKLMFGNRRGSDRWSDEVEEAFFQALAWAEEFAPMSRMKIEGRSHFEIVAGTIYELTGQRRCRKAVSSHIQVLKGVSRSSKTVNTDPAENTPLLIHDPVLTAALKLNRSLSLHRSTPFAQDLLSLSLVNRLYRTECLHHLVSSLHFNFGFDSRALQRFCSTTPPEILEAMHYLSVSLVEGYMPDLPTLPNLRVLAIDLWPRNATRQNQEDRAWGPQTQKLLAALGTEVAARARISLEMRWATDCERFEREYVGKVRRGRVIGDEGIDAPDPERVLCRRRYEFCGNGWTIVGETGENEGVAFADVVGETGENEGVAFSDVGFLPSC